MVYIYKALKFHLVCYHVTAKLWAHKCWCLCVQNIRLLTYTVLQNQLVRLDYKPYVLMAATVVSILYMMDECGLLHYSIIILQKVTWSQWIFCEGHRQFLDSHSL